MPDAPHKTGKQRPFTDRLTVERPRHCRIYHRMGMGSQIIFHRNTGGIHMCQFISVKRFQVLRTDRGIYQNPPAGFEAHCHISCLQKLAVLNNYSVRTVHVAPDQDLLFI